MALVHLRMGESANYPFALIETDELRAIRAILRAYNKIMDRCRAEADRESKDYDDHYDRMTVLTRKAFGDSFPKWDHEDECVWWLLRENGVIYTKLDVVDLDISRPDE